ncbi:MAG: hypothetical protein H0T69_09695 [Thermoleophilaceae bacterium]|nr:hypothetical protein [Thermoleophilaceae bacterium]
MQTHRTDGDDLAPRSANPSPPIGHVHGLGESHALRVDLEPVQLPWLADEVDTLRRCIIGELARDGGRSNDLPAQSMERPWSDADAELHRRVYQLRVLVMIREQLPVSIPVVAACVTSPWDQPSDLALELARITAPVTVVGPARGMLVLIRGAARNVANALAEALEGPQRETRPRTNSYAAHWPEWLRVTSPVANRLRAIAAAAHAFTDTYVTAVAQQSYSFDPEHHPVYPDELW